MTLDFKIFQHNSLSDCPVTQSVEKVWENGSKDKPDIKAQLFQNGLPYLEPVVLNGKNDWKHEWEKLPTEDSEGTPFKYTVDEVELPENYDKEIDFSTITNRYVSPKIEFTVNKIWVGGPEDRPTIKVALKRDGEVYDTIELDGSEDWTYTWTDLDETDADGFKYDHTVD